MKLKCPFYPCLAAVTAFIATATLHAGEPHIAREAIEWADIWVTMAQRLAGLDIRT